MPYLFKQSKQVAALQTPINQNNDIYAGRDQLNINMDKYYDGLELDSADQKAARWKRTPKYLYYPKIISSFTSSIYKKPPQYVLPLEDEELKNIDLLGNNLNEYTSQIPLEVLKQGFCATIIDYSDAMKKPYFIFIPPEQFVSFQVKYDKGYPELSQFIYSVMEESRDQQDEFSVKLSKVHYVWDIVQTLDKNGQQTPQARVRKYIRETVQSDENNYYKVKDKTENSDELQSTSLIVANGNPLPALPIIIHGKESNNFTIEKSVLQDVSDLNIDLFNRVVDQIEVLHMTALPTPFILGADPEDPFIPKTLGSNKLWVLDNQDAKVGLLEFSGKSSEAHRDYIEDLKEAMAVSGAQILKPQGVSRETATSVLIRTGQETAIITSIVQNISSQIETMLRIYCEWYGKDTTEISYELNSDFVSVDMEPNAQIALVRSWLDGAISHKSMFKKMKQGELIESNKSFDEEISDIKSNPPTFPAKEKDAEIAAEQSMLDASLAPKPEASGTNADSNKTQKPETKGDPKETGNSQKNTEIKN